MRPKKRLRSKPNISIILVASPLPPELASASELKKFFLPSNGVLSVSMHETQKSDSVVRYALITVKNFLVAADIIKQKNGQKVNGISINVFIKPPKKLPKIPKKERRASNYTLYKPNPKFRLRRMPGSHGRQ
jgi:hypothetical protein